MDTFTFGLTMLVVGMGGTLLTLALLALIIRGITVLLPPGTDPKRGTHREPPP